MALEPVDEAAICVGLEELSPGSTEVGSPDTQLDRSSCSHCSRSPDSGRLQLDLEVVEGTSAFNLLFVPRERSTPGISSPGPLPTVLGRRECSKNSSKSITASYPMNPSSPQSSLALPRSPPTSWFRWRREAADEMADRGPALGYFDTAAASRESDITLRKWSVGVRTLLQLQGGRANCWLCFSALASLLLAVTALYAVLLAPRDDRLIMDWRVAEAQAGRAEMPTYQADPGCTYADHVGFYSMLAMASVAGLAACLMYVNSGGSAHILSAAGYALLNWFQGLVAAMLPAHERAKIGCAYGLMKRTFEPQEMRMYDSADYYKEYYGVIIVRTLLFLAGLIWMQHLMVRRVLAVEITSRREFGGKCLSTSIAAQKVALTVACGVSVWIYSSIDDVDTQETSRNLLDHGSYFVGFGGLNFLLFLITAATVLVVMKIILCDLSKALRVTDEFAATHPRTRRAAQQLKRARNVVRRQLAGVALNGLASTCLLPLAVKTVLDGRGYIDKSDFATTTAVQVVDMMSCVAAALILSGGYRRPVDRRQQGDPEPCSCPFASMECGHAEQPELNTSSSCEEGVQRSSTAWGAKVMDLAERGVTLRELLSFYRQLKTVMPHFRPSVHTTHDVVRHAIIPMTKHARSSYVQAFSETRRQPMKMVTHWWGNRFVDLIAAVVADALQESSYGLVSRLMQKDIDVIEKMLERCERLEDCYWICAFCVNQHAAICDRNQATDSLTGLPHPLCDCGLPKYYDGDECEMNKFDEMMGFLAARDPNFCQVVAVDSDFGVFTRAWCMAEVAQASYLGITTQMRLRDKEGLIRTGARLRDLDVREMKASRAEDVEHILAKIPDKDAFNAALQRLIFDHRSGLLAAWRDLDSSMQMGEAGRLLFWTLADAGSGVVWKCWDF